MRARVRCLWSRRRCSHACFTYRPMVSSILRPMPGFSTLVRLLLSAVLILNGTGTAVAGTRMQLHAAGEQIAAPAAAKVDEPPCHQQMASTAAQNERPAIAAKARIKSKVPSPDCCKFASCGCACMYSAAGVAVSAFVHHSLYANAAIHRTQAAGHRPPTLPHLIRPPIG